MATFRARMTGTGEKTWQAMVRRKGFAPKVATFRTRREAGRRAATIDGEIASRRHNPAAET